jgi:sec-independent protein translocase protein TatC|tara:strand:+ start:404 stop:1159 length:756 start_codon:yes stop_codon:yes gene_type:complete
MKKHYKIFNHIEEFKYRSVYIVISFILSFSTLYLFLGETTYVLIKPLFGNDNQEVQELIYTDMAEAFFASIKLTIFFAFYSSIPMILYHIYFFTMPGMYIHEQKVVLNYIIISISLTTISSFVAYTLFVPLIWDFFLNYDFNLNKDIFQVSFQGKIIEYINLITNVFLSFILCFQIPLIFLILLKIEFISSKSLKKYRSINIVFCFICGALLSPPDVFSQICIAIPLCFVYEINILISLFLSNKKSYLETN